MGRFFFGFVFFPLIYLFILLFIFLGGGWVGWRWGTGEHRVWWRFPPLQLSLPPPVRSVRVGYKYVGLTCERRFWLLHYKESFKRIFVLINSLQYLTWTLLNVGRMELVRGSFGYYIMKKALRGFYWLISSLQYLTWVERVD